MRARWYPLADLQSELGRMRDEMDRLFGRYASGGRRGWPTVSVFPAMNVWEDDQSFLVEAELPGLELSDLEILVNAGSLLTVKGQRREPEWQNGSWHRRERSFGAFARTLELPAPVDPDHVEASFKNGVLRIRLPKAEQARPRRIEVRAN